MRAEEEVFEDLSDLVWNHFMAADSEGKTGKDRNQYETTAIWASYHSLQKEYSEIRHRKKLFKEKLRKLQLLLFSIFVTLSVVGFLKFWR